MNVLSTMPFLAYLDPGTGSMVLQAMVAGLFSGLFLLRSSWGRVRPWLVGDRDAQHAER
jgi:hypothetical protein